MLNLAQLSIKSGQVNMAHDALTIDLRFKMVNNQITEYYLSRETILNQKRSLVSYKMQCLPYLKSLYLFFAQWCKHGFPEGSSLPAFGEEKPMSE